MLPTNGLRLRDKMLMTRNMPQNSLSQISLNGAAAARRMREKRNRFFTCDVHLRINKQNATWDEYVMPMQRQ